MTTAQEVEQYADTFGDSYPATVVLLRQYATLLRQTTEGTDALVSDLSEEANIVHCYEEMTNLCRTYEQRLKATAAQLLQESEDRILESSGFIQERVALQERLKVVEVENARLKAAMDKYSEDEVLLIERCAKACEEVYKSYEKKCDTWPEARPDALSGAEDCIQAIRALSPNVDQEPVQTIGGSDPEYLAEVFWRNKERRSGGERRVSKGNKWRDECWNVLRSGTDRRKT